MIGRDGELQHHRPLWARIAGELRALAPDVYLVGEHFFDPDKLLKGDGLDGAMAYHGFTFPLRAWLSGRDRRGAAAAIGGGELVAHLRAAFARVGWASWRRSSLHVNTHDLPRLQSECGDGRALDVATVLQLGLPGVPCLYYGDEVGLEGGADPDNRRCMVWDEASWDRARLERVAALVRRRRGSPSLRRGGLVDLGSAGDLVALARVQDGAATELVVASRADEPIEVELPAAALPGGRAITVSLAPRSAELVPLPG
jgi:alpha-glucosidase